MKIGIVTYHRSHNYGALLQAIALRYKLKELGHDVYYIDYWPKYHRRMYAIFSWKTAFSSGIRNCIKCMLNTFLFGYKIIRRYRSFKIFIRKYVEPYCVEYSEDGLYDIIVYGSDQIWRKQVGLANHFNPVYFADNVISAQQHVAYAASMGIISLNDDDIKFLREKLSKFSKISVREENLQVTLNKIGISSKLVLDPTLLFPSAFWEELLPLRNIIHEKYILHYRLIKTSFLDDKVAEFAIKHNCRLIILDGDIGRKSSMISSSDPIGFLSLVKNAEFVFTSSYHGLIFSLIFNKQFFASFAVNSDRAISILSYLGLEYRLLLPQSEIPDNYSDIDYIEINKKIDLLKIQSIDFLRDL